MLEAEDTYVGCGELHDGSFFTLEATTAARPVDLEASISILGESGFIKIGGIAINKIEQAIIQGVEVSDDEKSSNSVEVENGYGDGHYHMFRDIVVSTSDPVALQMAGDYGCFIHERGIDDSGSVVGIQQVYCDALLAYENEIGIPDSVTLAHETYPFRHEETFNYLYRVFMESGADSVVCGAEEKRLAFILDKNNETVLNESLGIQCPDMHTIISPEEFLIPLLIASPGL